MQINDSTALYFRCLHLKNMQYVPHQQCHMNCSIKRVQSLLDLLSVVFMNQTRLNALIV